MPAVRRADVELVFDELADNRNFAVAERIGNNVACGRRQKHHRYRAYDSRKRKGKRRFDKGLNLVCAEVLRSFDKAFVEFD